jgi:hypothetical protein
LQPTQALYGSELYEVSVAVFYKRDVVPSPKSERCLEAALNIGGEVVLYAADNADGVDAVDNALKDIRPGQWIALAGVHPDAGFPSGAQLLLKWYRLLSLDEQTLQGQYLSAAGGSTYAVRRGTIEGPDWPVPSGTTAPTIQNLRAILLPGVIGVSTHMLHMEPSSLK